MGVEGRSVEGADELGEAVDDALRSDGPRLVHVRVSGHRPGAGS
jgi:thiamine pyrophosphate-dependent acetolactate synthase large subunit-like protein